MTFTSLNFFLFFAIVLVIYWFLRKREQKNLFLLLASYAFYFYFDLIFGFILLVSSAVDYLLALGMEKQPEKRKTFLWAGVVLNLGSLVLMRHFGFFVDSLNLLLVQAGLEMNVSLLAPLGISFYTLKKLSYILDVYRGKQKPSRRLVDYALFVSFFPQIQAGPIDRARNLLAQIEQKRVWKPEFFNRAWPLIISGLFKKLVIAGGLAVYVDRIFVLDEPGSILLVLAGATAFAVQILADFSAYTDLSRGIALLLGFETPENFMQPYTSLTPTDFWNRWHITLSQWFRDYIFYPLRRMLLRRKIAWLAAVVPPMMVMLVSGLWHGNGWNFMLWGVMHGVWIVAYQLLGMGGAWQPKSVWTKVLAWLAVMAFLISSWMVFRAPTLGWLWGILVGAPLVGDSSHVIFVLVTLSAAAFYSLLWNIQPLLQRVWQRIPWVEPLYYASAMVLTIIYSSPLVTDFIYFRF